LDYVPFLLQAIDTRRVRVEREARYFLGATVVSALLFSGVVMYFGYILVNEASAGSTKILSEVRQNTGSIAQNLSFLDLRVSNPQFQKQILPLLKQVKTIDPGGENKNSKATLDTELSSAEVNDAPLQSVADALQEASSVAKTGGKQESNYRDLLEDIQQRLSSLGSQQLDTQNQIRQLLGETKPLIESAQKSIQEPTNRTAELIKRLGLGIVVSTFFLALLRYFGGLYKARYEQVIAAQADEFMVRRFYVGFKGSLDSVEQRKAVLASFMDGSKATVPMPPGGGEPDDSSKQSFELLKDLMGALSKKL
jgi:predicted PurR-regulated permease PerM